MSENTQKKFTTLQSILLIIPVALISAIACYAGLKLIGANIAPAIVGGVAGAVAAVSLPMIMRKKK